MAFLPLPGLAEISIFSKIGGFFKKLFSSPWFYVVLIVLAIGGGTYFYLKNDKADAVEQARTQATEQADTRATIQSYEAQTETANRTREIDQQYQIKREQTVKDYANVRNTIQNAPAEDRDAQAPAVIIDTLNELDRMHLRREHEGPVHHPEPPVG